jgi:extracellular elastinolytic metalloproteinase
MSLANVASSTLTVSLEDAIASAEQTINGTFNEHPPTLEFLMLEVGCPPHARHADPER